MKKWVTLKQNKFGVLLNAALSMRQTIGTLLRDKNTGDGESSGLVQKQKINTGDPQTLTMLLFA